MKNVFYFIVLLLLGVLKIEGKDLDSSYELALEALNDKPLSEAKSAALEFLSEAKSENDKYYLVKAYYLLGYLSDETEDFSNAVIYYLEGARFAEQLSDKDIKNDLISIYKNLANILGDYKHFDLAHKFINKGLEISKSIQNESQTINLLSNRVHEYLDEKKYGDAINVIEEILQQHSPDKSSLISLKNKSGIAYMELMEYEQAMKSFQFIIENATPENRFYAHAIHNIADIHLKLGEFNQATTFFTDAVEAKKSTGMRKDAIKSLCGLAESYFALNQYKTGITFLLEAEHLDTTELSSLDPDTYYLYKKLSKAYEHTGNQEKALAYNTLYSTKLEKFIAQQKEIQDLDKRHNIELLTERYYELLVANEEKREAERIAQYGVSGAIIFIMLFILIYFRYQYIRSNIKKEISKIEFLSEV